MKKQKKIRLKANAASTQAGEFVHDEIEKVKKGKHGVRNVKQAIAIGLSEARRAGFNAPTKNASKAVKKKAKQDEARAGKPVNQKRSRARIKALKKEPTNTVSSKALSKQAKSAAKKRSASDRSAAAKKASRTKGSEERSAAAKKAARTRAKNKNK